MRLAQAFCLASLLPLSLSSPVAHAKTIVVEREMPAAASVGGATFDAALSAAGQARAWIVVDFVEHSGEDEQVYSERIVVPGLTYDAATRTIHLQDGDGRDVTCAVGKRLLWATRFRATSDCPIQVRKASEASVGGAAAANRGRFVIQVDTAPSS